MTTTTDSISVQAAKEHPLPEYHAGHVVGGRYEIVEKLGEGMLGAVYKVKHRTTGQILALKLLRPRLVAEEMDVDRFSHELQLGKSLDHHGIVQVLDSGEFEGSLYFTMEYVDGRSLRDLLNDYRARGEDMPAREMQQILRSTLEILKHAHSVTIHRNLKPENLLVVEKKGADGRKQRSVKLTDFAIAHVVSPTIFANSSLNREGAFYLAPELSEFGDKANPNSDLYSVGAIFYEMLCGTPPMGRYEMPSVVRHGQVSEKVDDFIEIALAPNPQDRFQSVDDMIGALGQVFEDLTGVGEAHLMRTLALLGLLVLVAASATVYFRSQKETPEEIVAAKVAARDTLRAEVKAKNGTPAPAPAVTDAKYADMIWIPGGTFIQGFHTGFDIEPVPDGFATGLAGEVRQQLVDQPGFWIDRYEMNFPEYPELDTDTPEEKAAKAARNQYASEPVRDLTWKEASTECERLGKRLCTETEWEKSCKGPDNFLYPAGDTYDDQRCPRSGYLPPPYKVTQFPLCTSAYGVWGLGGGVMEWTATPDGNNYIVKGGAVGNEEKGTRCAARIDRPPQFSQQHIGARCCAD